MVYGAGACCYNVLALAGGGRCRRRHAGQRRLASERATCSRWREVDGAVEGTQASVDWPASAQRARAGGRWTVP